MERRGGVVPGSYRTEANTGMKVYIEGAGCDRRQLDTQRIRRYLALNGHRLVDEPGTADRILIVTCAFKALEERESARRVQALKGLGRQMLILGCLPDIAGERHPHLEDIPFVSPKELDSIDDHFAPVKVPFVEVPDAHVIDGDGISVSRVRERLRRGVSRERLSDEVARFGLGRLRRLMGGGEQVYQLFVCRGCAGACSYCGIRSAIGGVVSKPISTVVSEFREGVEQGYSAFSILGDDPGCYGSDIGATLPDLLGALFSEAERLSGSGAASPRVSPRFRIREIHPKFLIRDHRRMIGLAGFDSVDNILCPVQSGSARVLDLMQREHTPEDLLEAITRLRERVPDLVMDTQVIVGFPGETPDEFQQTLDLVRAAAFDTVVVFPYDDKPGAAASQLADKVPPEEIDRRMREAFRYFRRHRITALHSCP